MSKKPAFRALLVAALWIGVMSLLAVSYRYFANPALKERVEGAPELSTKQWQELAVSNVRAEPIGFARGSAQLSDENRRQLQDLCADLRNSPQLYVRVIGDVRAAEDAAEAEANLRLAQTRAQVVAEFLSATGISFTRLTVTTAKSANNDGAQTVMFVIGTMP